MSRIGFVLREAYVLVAIEKATPSQAADLEDVRARVLALEQLELSFPERLLAARTAAGVSTPALSKAAQDASAVSAGADADHHRLLLRRCRRAETSTAVVQELLTSLRDDLDFEEFILEQADETVVRDLQGEIVKKKRALERVLQRFLEEDSSPA